MLSQAENNRILLDESQFTETETAGAPYDLNAQEVARIMEASEMRDKEQQYRYSDGILTEQTYCCENHGRRKYVTGKNGYF